jgi:hypothetical protein
MGKTHDAKYQKPSSLQHLLQIRDHVALFGSVINGVVSFLLECFPVPRQCSMRDASVCSTRKILHPRPKRLAVSAGQMRTFCAARFDERHPDISQIAF